MNQKPLKILVVDDNVWMLEVLDYAFRMDGYEVVTADDGKKALSVSQEGHFDIIVSDINMPFLNGIDFGFQLRKFDVSTPIIYFSAEVNGQATYGLEVQKMGKATFIEDKNINVLLNSVRQFLPK